MEAAKKIHGWYRLVRREEWIGRAQRTLWVVKLLLSNCLML
jgi:hypothetical protein